MNLIPLDLIGENICKELSFRDMGRAIQVSRTWMQIFISDPCYIHYKRKVLKNHPNFQKIFDRYPWPFLKRASQLRPSKAKKRRKVWIFPRAGTRYVFKSWIRAVSNYKLFYYIVYRKSDTDMRNIFFEEWLRSCFLYIFPEVQIEIKLIKEEGKTFHFECNGDLLKMQMQCEKNIWLGGKGTFCYTKLHDTRGELFQLFKKSYDPGYRLDLKSFLFKYVYP